MNSPDLLSDVSMLYPELRQSLPVNSILPSEPMDVTFHCLIVTLVLFFSLNVSPIPIFVVFVVSEKLQLL